VDFYKHGILKNMNKLSQIKKLTCPCCLKKVSVSDTPLLSYFYDYQNIDPGRVEYFKKRFKNYKKYSTTFEPFKEFVHWADNVHLESPNQIVHHQHMWACNICIEKGRAIVGDYRKQRLLGQAQPIIAYVDTDRTCARCKSSFVFSAQEQMHWYEILGIPTDAIPKQCAECRKEIRSGRYPKP